MNWLCTCKKHTTSWFQHQHKCIIHCHRFFINLWIYWDFYDCIQLEVSCLAIFFWTEEIVRRISRSKDYSRVDFSIHSSRERPLHITILHKNLKRYSSSQFIVMFIWDVTYKNSATPNWPTSKLASHPFTEHSIVNEYYHPHWSFMIWLFEANFDSCF